MEQQAQAVGTAREMQERREAWSSYRQHQAAWLNACMQALQGALQPAKAAAAAPVPQRGALQFELLSDDVVENKILASRMAVAMRVRRTEGGHSTRAMGLGPATAPASTSQPSSAYAPTQMGGAPGAAASYPPNGALPQGQMPVGLTTLSRARHRAHEVVGQLRRLLMQPGVGVPGLVPGVGGVGGVGGGLQQAPASAALTQALLEQRVVAQTQYQQMLARGLTTLQIDASPAAIGQLVGQVRERSAELKRKATTSGEKAKIGRASCRERG